MTVIDLKAKVHRGGEALLATVHNGLAVFGMLALLFLVASDPMHWPKRANAIDTLQFPAIHAAFTRTTDVVEAAVADPRQRALAGYLARKYRVSGEATENLVTEAFRAARRTSLDPLLILAVMAVESSFNPIAESTYGAKGLMQVVPRFHLDKLAYHGGAEAVLDPRINIRVGAEILSDYIRRAGGLQPGLQLYAGAPEDPANQYAQKVLAEAQRLRQVAATPVPEHRAVRPVGSDA